MRLTRGQILYTLTLAAVLGAFGAVYQFYFKEKLAQYAADERFLTTLETTFIDLEKAFSGIKPERLISAWRAEQQPWADSVQARTSYFSFGDWLQVEGEPQQGEMWKFWYDKTVNAKVWELYQKVAERMGTYNNFPPDIRGDLGLKTLDDWKTGDVTRDDVMRELRRLQFGIKLSQLLLDSKASSVQALRMWPIREEKRFGKILRFQTAGITFTMTPKDFVELMEKLRLEDRYFSVDSLRVVNTCIACQTEPHYTIDMLLSQARYVEGAQAPAAAATAKEQFIGGSAATMSPRRQREPPPPEPGPIGKAWKWFKRTVLVMN
jgi:hypothetical protein